MCNPSVQGFVLCDRLSLHLGYTQKIFEIIELHSIPIALQSQFFRKTIIAVVGKEKVKYEMAQDELACGRKVVFFIPNVLF